MPVYLLSFKATDAGGESCAGSVTVDVPHDQGNGSTAVLSPGRWNSITGQLMIAPPPVANDDSQPVAQQVIAVHANDVIYGPAPKVTIVSAPSEGAVTVNANGTITYKAPSPPRVTSFTYRLANSSGSDTAVVRITIGNKSNGDRDDDDHDRDDNDCGDSNHDHGRDSDARDRDHRQRIHGRCRHSR